MLAIQEHCLIARASVWRKKTIGYYGECKNYLEELYIVVGQ